MEGDGLAEAQADDALLAGQQVDVDQIGAAYGRPQPAHDALRQVDDQRRQHPDLHSQGGQGSSLYWVQRGQYCRCMHSVRQAGASSECLSGKVSGTPLSWLTRAALLRCHQTGVHRRLALALGREYIPLACCATRTAATVVEAGLRRHDCARSSLLRSQQPNHHDVRASQHVRLLQNPCESGRSWCGASGLRSHPGDAVTVGMRIARQSRPRVQQRGDVEDSEHEQVAVVEPGEVVEHPLA